MPTDATKSESLLNPRIVPDRNTGEPLESGRTYLRVEIDDFTYEGAPSQHMLRRRDRVRLLNSRETVSGVTPAAAHKEGAYLAACMALPRVRVNIRKGPRRSGCATVTAAVSARAGPPARGVVAIIIMIVLAVALWTRALASGCSGRRRAHAHPSPRPP
jgi:hypothetical protein